MRAFGVLAELYWLPVAWAVSYGVLRLFGGDR